MNFTGNLDEPINVHSFQKDASNVTHLLTQNLPFLGGRAVLSPPLPLSPNVSPSPNVPHPTLPLKMRWQEKNPQQWRQKRSTAETKKMHDGDNDLPMRRRANRSTTG